MTNAWNSDKPFSCTAHWFSSKECIKWIQNKTSHDENLHWLRYAIKNYIAPALHDDQAKKPRDQYRCLILGANEGWMERLLCKEGFIGEIVASDIADKALARAQAKSQSQNYRNITYVVADLNTHQFPGQFDYIICEGVLHHIEKIENCLRNLERSLTPEGIIFAAEYEGPARFQLPELQVRWINAALNVLPAGLRPVPSPPRPLFPLPAAMNEKVYYVPPSAQSIIAIDSSEAICGPLLKKAIRDVFTIIERNGFGGTLLSYMTGHFDFDRTNTDPFCNEWVKVLMRIEDSLIQSRILEDDFVFYVLKKKTGQPV